MKQPVLGSPPGRCVLQRGETRRKMPQDRRLVGKGIAAKLTKMPRKVSDHLDHVVHMTLRVYPARHGQADQFPRSRSFISRLRVTGTEHHGPDFDGANPDMLIEGNAE